ncbi:hypothetical protein IGB42_02256 [Andreprevotia sp. IGB-42]|uniref:DUF2092 domain-containing protein n=1 Tax=Andreprevotia sp. IGB-42 TaxID=2497473 RepID=UPI001358CA44|nr:DUF2092 domain-containing protein [Andreprevotia sp. IGB-42]KAF0813327.1 hypothetical protein IGB42_02256 [Andreprevotia sp. IGB-42]
MTFKAKLLFVLLAPLASSAWAADDAPAEDNPINPKVIDKLVQVGQYLRSLPKFKVDAQITRDVVLETGQKIKVGGTSQVVVDGRSRLYASLESDTQNRRYFFNGKKFTQYSPALKYYGTVDAPETLSEALHQFEEHYGLRLPMEDLFLLGQDQSQLDALTAAAYVGSSSINGKQCDHLAFRQEGADWQLWVSHSDKPLPCKLVITTTEDTSYPEYSAVYSWNLKPDTNAASFTFKPAKGDVAISITKAAQ